MDNGVDLKRSVIAGIIILVIIGAGVYFLFLRGDDDGGNGDDGPDAHNRSPVADAGPDITVHPGELFYLNGTGSIDTDGDPLTYFWDMDIGTDTNNDGSFDNDKNREGVNISYSYPSTGETIKYLVTLNISDGELTDKSIVYVTVVVSSEDDLPPEIQMSCIYQAPPLGLPGDPQFIVTISSVSRNESYFDFYFILESPTGETIRDGAVIELFNLSQDEEIRFVDTPAIGEIDENDLFSFKETTEIVEGCWFHLFYLYERDPSGSVELIK